MAREALCDRGADPRTGAGDEHALAGKISELEHLSSACHFLKP
jgi:hypothetical protein